MRQDGFCAGDGPAGPAPPCLSEPASPTPASACGGSRGAPCSSGPNRRASADASGAGTCTAQGWRESLARLHVLAGMEQQTSHEHCIGCDVQRPSLKVLCHVTALS